MDSGLEKFFMNWYLQYREEILSAATLICFESCPIAKSGNEKRDIIKMGLFLRRYSGKPVLQFECLDIYLIRPRHIENIQKGGWKLIALKTRI